MITVGLTLGLTQPTTGGLRLTQQFAYAQAIECAGAVALLVAPLGNREALRQAYQRCDALCLPGGDDVNPALYGASAESATHPTAGVVEDTEVQLLRWALEDDLPVLAICRGMQLLNVVLGGTLAQDLDRAPVDHSVADLTRLAHPISVLEGSRLHSLAGETHILVNSHHHQGIARLAPGLVVTATADDGLIEAVELAGHSHVVGVQFHPEALAASLPWAQRLFAELVDATRVARPASSPTTGAGSAGT